MSGCTGSGYRYCGVPNCTNTTISTPNKIFICVPQQANRRRKWLQLARRDHKQLSENTILFFCEDHFDLPNDMENYMRYKLLGVQRIKMKKNCIPTRFECQPDRSKRTAPVKMRSAVLKRQKLQVLNEVQEGLDKKEFKSNIDEDQLAHCSQYNDKAVQANIRVHFRSKGIQCNMEMQHEATSPLSKTASTVTITPRKSDYISENESSFELSAIKKEQNV